MPQLVDTFLVWLGTYRVALTAPGFQNLLVIVVGWVQTTGRHAVTQSLVASGVAGRRHHAAFHRFFSRGTWNPDRLGYWLFERVRRVLALDPHGLRVVIDDTVAAKKGPHVFGIGSHLDAVRSTKRFRVFCFGHCWVVLAILVRLPFSRRPWALPILFRLYRNQKECARKRHPYRKKTELARELLDVFHGWVGAHRVEVAADAAYCNDTVTRGLPSSFVLFGAMRPDAVLTALPDKCGAAPTGRRRRRGAALPKPQALARDDRKPWRTCEADLYGHRRTVRYKEMSGQWYRACGVGLLRIVIVQVTTGALGCRVFFCTDATRSVCQILEGYAGRWAIEVCFRNLKQELGFAESSARTRAAVERVAPFVGLLYTLLVAWFTEHASTHALAAPPVRPWYRHKQGFAFADILRTAQRVLAPLDVLDPNRSLDNLRRSNPPAGSSTRRRGAQSTNCVT
jgi:DDE superfamily endonuclease